MGIEPEKVTAIAQEPKAEETPFAAGIVASPPAPQFHPLLLNAHAAKGKHESRLSHVGLNFNLSSFVSYYPMLRLTGYTFEAAYSPVNRTLQKIHLRALDKLSQQEPLNWQEEAARRYYGDTVPGVPKNPFISGASDAAKKNIGWKNAESSAVAEKKIDFHEYESNYKTRFNRVESAVFTALALVHSHQNYNQIKDTLRLAVATEFGKDQKDVTFSDFRRSNNPIVVSAMDRLCWQVPMRTLAGASFAKNLALGIIANSIVITAERTIFYRPIAFDLLSKAVNDVQINNLGPEVKGEVVDNLIRSLQAARFDHRQPSIPREQIEGLRPVLDMVADDIISKRFGITGMMYIMGGGVLIPEDPQQSLANYQHVRDVGVSGVMEEAKKIKADRKVPSSKIWDAELMDKPRSKQQGEQNIAESARREELLRERRAILARGPLHSTPGSGVDPDARYGTVQMY